MIKMKEQIEDIFLVTIGKNAGFLCQERRLGASKPEPEWLIPHDIEHWLIQYLNLKEYKRYKIKVDVKLLEEVER